MNLDYPRGCVMVPVRCGGTLGTVRFASIFGRFSTDFRLFASTFGRFSTDFRLFASTFGRFSTDFRLFDSIFGRLSTDFRLFASTFGRFPIGFRLICIDLRPLFDRFPPDLGSILLAGSRGLDAHGGLLHPRGTVAIYIKVYIKLMNFLLKHDGFGF